MEEKTPKILVTGASGFAAGWVVKQLLEANYWVRGTVRSLKNEEKIAHLIQLGKENEDRLELVEADLLDPVEKWDNVVAGCSHVCHTASPFPLEVPKDEQELIKPAVDGTLTVLLAAANNSIRRVVLTSSVASIYAGWPHDDNKIFSEKDWAIPENSVPYQKSKFLAEKAAWDFVNNLPEDKKIELVTICPSLILGPLLSKTGGDSSQKVISRFLKNDMPGVPNLWFNIVDVRDVAKAHVISLFSEKTPGNRYICSNTGHWMMEVAQILDQEFSPKGYKITTSSVPSFLLWVVSFFDADAAGVYPRLNKKQILDTKKIREDLGIEFISAKEAILEMAYSQIKFGLVPKK